MALLFISHSSADAKAAASFAARLRGRGYEGLFLDFDPERSIPAGRRWEEELYAQLRRADAVVFLASPDSVGSIWCAVEIGLARSAGKPVFPVTISETSRLKLLADAQWLDLTRDGDSVFDRLVDGLSHAGIDPSDSFAWDGRRSPYPGLLAFAPEDAAVFFGREREVDRVLSLLHPTVEREPGRFIAVMGPSGSGKSSLVNAGVLPRLAVSARSGPCCRGWCRGRDRSRIWPGVSAQDSRPPARVAVAPRWPRSSIGVPTGLSHWWTSCPT